MVCVIFLTGCCCCVGVSGPSPAPHSAPIFTRFFSLFVTRGDRGDSCGEGLVPTAEPPLVVVPGGLNIDARLTCARPRLQKRVFSLESFYSP